MRRFRDPGGRYFWAVLDREATEELHARGDKREIWLVENSSIGHVGFSKIALDPETGEFIRYPADIPADAGERDFSPQEDQV